MDWSRRGVLGAGAGALVGSLLPRRVRAQAAGQDLRFVFVLAQGGWDPTRAFAPLFDHDNAAMEPDAVLATQGDLAWVEHPERPAVGRFFRSWADRSLILNGLVVPSLSHDTCMQWLLTGGTVANAGDWPVLLAAAAGDRYPLPHVVLEGPSYPGLDAGLVTRVGSSGAVQRLLDGSLLSEADGVSLPPATDTLARTDALVQRITARRLAAAGDAHQEALYQRHHTSLQRAQAMQALADQVAWAADSSLLAQVGAALDLLRLDACRCLTLTSIDPLWDSHSDNDWNQSVCFEMLFQGVEALVAGLAATPSSRGGTLADETVVCVLSEMGRTPQLNNLSGKDHWSHTSALLVGPGLTGGRVVGAYDGLIYGVALDPGTGEVDPGGRALTVGSLGATLLALGGVDPGEALPDEVPVTGILA